jgi:hypothetical protein
MSQFIYLLNSMECAATAENPAEHGYADKRRAVLEYVAKLEATAPEERALLQRAADALQGTATGLQLGSGGGGELIDKLRELADEIRLYMNDVPVTKE